MAKPDLSHATQAELVAALRQTDDSDYRVDAACAAGDQLRFDEMGPLSADLGEALASQMDDGPWNELRYESAIALCEAKDPRADKLIELLDDKNRRFDACKALSRLNIDSVRAAMHTLAGRFFLPWPDKLVASAACAVFGDREGSRYFERTLLSRWFGARRAMALHLLGELRHPEAFTLLTALVENKDEGLRHVAIRALGHLGDRRAVSQLRALADNEVAEDVAYALDLLAP